MADFAVRVVRISAPVEHHPDADRLSLIKIGGYVAISAKLNEEEAAARGKQPGDHRYEEGDFVVYVPEGAVLPENLLRGGFWNAKENKGGLAGSKGDRVKALKLRGVFSQGILFPVEKDERDDTLMLRVPIWHGDECIGANKFTVTEGQNVADLMGITKYEPPIPVHMAGEVLNLFGTIKAFDFESIQTVPDLFSPGEAVHVTEKLHGTFCQIGWVPGLGNAECFADGNVYVASKGLGNKGLAFKDNEANKDNLYVRTLRKMIADGLVARLPTMLSDLASFVDAHDAPVDMPVRLFGEIFGQGVQDLHYGLKEPGFRLFDVMIGDVFASPGVTEQVARMLGLPMVPVLYTGPYDLSALEAVRDGKDTLSGTHVREGIVIRAMDGGRHPLHGRKIGKWVSPAYLLRKGAGEEVQ